VAARGARAAIRARSAHRVLTAFTEANAEAQSRIAAFQHELRKLGWSDGRNIVVESRFSGGDSERARAYAAELLGIAPDVILAETTQVMLELQRATRTVPIVFVNVGDPIERGFVSNLARPEVIITGFTNIDHAATAKLLEMLREITPGFSKVLVIFDPKNPTAPPRIRAIEAAAETSKVELVKVGISNVDDIERAISGFAREYGGGLIVLPSPFLEDHRAVIFTLVMKYRLPAVYPFRHLVSSGGLMSYGTDLTDLYRRAASYVDRVLRGARPADLPVQQPTKFELVINLKAARAIGLEVPPQLLARADEVIE